MLLDRWVAACLVPIAIWVAFNCIDDVVLDALWIWRWLRNRTISWPSAAERDAVPARPIAIFLPLWKEHGVIGAMLRRNLASIRYTSYDVFVGVYPNDVPTIEAVPQHARVHLVYCPHEGPTSKADCLNWVYRGMLAYEIENGMRFEAIVTHDAEDVIHPDSLAWINCLLDRYDMVQIPVLPERRSLFELTAGVYCDDFAEFHSKDLEIRGSLGGFIPSSGVGTGFSRAVIDRLAGTLVFQPECQTEDYENGYRIHRLNYRQIFLPLRRERDDYVATREYFPNTFLKAVRQRTRWTIGVAMQGWERHGWGQSLADAYWFWRDRKGLAGSVVTPVGNLACIYGLLTWAIAHAQHRPWGLGELQNPALEPVFACTLALPFVHLAVRSVCVARVYGWAFALLVPARSVVANALNCLAALRAIHQYWRGRLRKQPLVWLKTDHLFPDAVEQETRVARELISSDVS